jgi:hypothetical protein
MKAHFEQDMAKHRPQAGINLSPEKKLILAESAVGISAAGELCEYVAARWWDCGEKNRPAIRCSIWVMIPGCDDLVSGSALVKGGNHDRLTHAFVEACQSAGITFDRPPNDPPRALIDDGLNAIATAAGAQKVLIVAH